LKFDFVIISLKKHNLAKLRNFKSPILKVKWGGEPKRGAKKEKSSVKNQKSYGVPNKKKVKNHYLT